MEILASESNYSKIFCFFFIGWSVRARACLCVCARACVRACVRMGLCARAKGKKHQGKRPEIRQVSGQRFEFRVLRYFYSLFRA